jgi:hypothetical protein
MSTEHCIHMNIKGNIIQVFLKSGSRGECQSLVYECLVVPYQAPTANVANGLPSTHY